MRGLNKRVESIQKGLEIKDGEPGRLFSSNVDSTGFPSLSFTNDAQVNATVKRLAELLVKAYLDYKKNGTKRKK